MTKKKKKKKKKRKRKEMRKKKHVNVSTPQHRSFLPSFPIIESTRTRSVLGD